MYFLKAFCSVSSVFFVVCFLTFVVFHSGTGSDVSCVTDLGLIQSVNDVSVKKGVFDCQTCVYFAAIWCLNLFLCLILAYGALQNKPTLFRGRQS